MDGKEKIHSHSMSLSLKLLSVLFIVVLFFLVIMFWFSLIITERLTESINENNGIITSTSLRELEKSLNLNAEQYLEIAANDVAKRIGIYIEHIKFDIIHLASEEKTREVFTGVLLGRYEYVHRLSDTAPVEGVSFPNEKDENDVELVPVFLSLTYVDANGMEKVKVEADKYATVLSDVSSAEYFIEAKKLKQGEIRAVTREYEIWDCTKRRSTVIGSQLYVHEGPCPRKGIMATNATGWRRFTSGYIRYFTPVYESGLFKGALIADINFLPIMKIVNDVKIGRTGYAYLQQSFEGTEEGSRGEGITIAHPSHHFVLDMDPTTLYKLTLPGLDDLNDLSIKQQKGNAGTGRYVFRGIDKYTSYASYNESGILWSVGVTMPVEEFTAAAKNARQSISNITVASGKKMIDTTEASLLVFLLCIVTALMVFFILLLLIVNNMVGIPLKKLRNAVVEISRGNLQSRVEVSSRDEIGDLALSFNQMANDLKHSQNDVKKAMHELEDRVAERTVELKAKVNELTQTKTAILNMMEDMDETNKQLVKMQGELKNSLNELKKLDVKKDEFISIAAHELKTPLTSIHGFSQLLQTMDVSGDAEKRKKFLKIINHETDRLARLVTDILDLSRIDLGTIKFTPEEVNVNEIMEDIRREMNVPIKAKNLKSGYEVEPRLPKIITDRERLIQILINLINNAVKYTPKGRIDIKVFRDGESIHFMVKDTGIGIDKMHSDKLFQRFYQIDSSYTRKAGGTGLGLALCKEFVTLLGGKIWFESKFGKGSKFHVTLPLIPPNFDAKAAYTRAEHAISNAGSASRRAKKLTVERRPDKQGPPTSKAPI